MRHHRFQFMLSGCNKQQLIKVEVISLHQYVRLDLLSSSHLLTVIFCMEITINIYLMLVAAFVNIMNTCCLLFHLASLPLCYRSELAILSPLCSMGVCTFSSLKESHAGKAGHQGDKAQIYPSTTEGEGSCWWLRTHEEIQMGFPFLSYWYTNILMQWELAGEIQGLLVMEKLWLA